MSSLRRNARGTIPPRVIDQRRLRMVVLGASKVGKTKLVSRFMGWDFSDVYIPTVEDFHSKLYTIRGQTYLLDILDTAGLPSNPLTSNITLMTGDMFLIVYSTTDESSFNYAKELVKNVEEAKRSIYEETHTKCQSSKSLFGRKKKLDAFVPIIIAGTKSDLENERAVPKGAVTNWLKKEGSARHNNHCAHVEVSAKNAESVQCLFERLFSLAHVPIEMSPNMHRKVSTNTFNEAALINTSKQRSPVFRSAVGCTERRRWNSGKSSPLSTSSNSSMDNTSGDVTFSFEATDTNALATTYVNQRRPSVTTEVNLAFDKAKHSQGVPECCSANNPYYSSKSTSSAALGKEIHANPLKKLKKKMSWKHLGIQA